jgi:hypothetical protein
MRQAPGEVLICSNFWLLLPPKQLHDAEFGQFDGIDHLLRVKAGNGNRGGHSALFLSFAWRAAAKPKKPEADTDKEWIGSRNRRIFRGAECDESLASVYGNNRNDNSGETSDR